MSAHFENALLIIRKLKAAGFSAFIVGGAVRDRELGIDAKDYDIATDAAPDDIKSLFERVVPVGEKFGVMLVIINSHPYEIARFRTESGYTDGRRPEHVAPATVQEDAFRRDFTINALYFDPDTDRVIDYTGGLSDIKNRIIRSVGDACKRFTEDRLRLLRAVRFAARFDFSIEADTYAAIKDQASEITVISAERIGAELALMMSGPNPGRALSLLDQSGLLVGILPEIAALKGVEQPPQFHPEGDVFEHTRLMLELFGGGALTLGGGSLTLGLGILLHDVGKPSTKTFSDRIRFHGHDAAGAGIAAKILSRLRQPKAVIERVTTLVKNHMRFIPAAEMKESTFRRLIAMEGFNELLELYRLDCLGSFGKLDGYEYVLKRMERQERELPKPLISGKDLLAQGHKSGPNIGKILDLVKDAQLEGELSERGDALQWVLKKHPAKKSRGNRKQKSNLPD